MLKLDTISRRTVETLPSRYSRLPWVLAAVSLAGLVSLAVPADRIRLGAEQLQGLVGSYAYRAPQPLAPIHGLTVDEAYLPGKLRIAWDDMGASHSYDGVHYLLQRIDPATGSVLRTEDLYDHFWVEDADFSTTTVYEFWVTLVPNGGGGSGGGDTPPFGANLEDIEFYPVPGPASKLRFRIDTTAASANQTVDSRYDLRYGNPTFLDFQFGDRTYRGGLFVGFANDPSRVARSFLKFPIPAGIEDGVYFTGSVNAYASDLLTTQSVEVGAQKISDASWNPNTLKWTTAPTVDPTQAPYRYTFTGGGWGHWSLASDIYDSRGTTDPLSIALASTAEGSAGRWVYLTKKELDTTLAPRVVIASHYPGDVPAAQSFTVVATNQNSVVLSWNSPIAIGLSVLQMREGNGAWQDVFTGDNTVPMGWWGGWGLIPAGFTEQVGNLTPNTQYQFRVKCETQCYGDYYSQRVSATTAP